ncbi:MAG: hypothetical protein D6698_14200 [Gammaproteobacteria bacterium]|nr:MAG: hypothetical protein D6698_14200 [Gammaproteobacteria bacterium]
MAIRSRTFDEMVRDGLEYLSNNTNITFLEQGSIARALVDASMLEINRLQDFVVTNYDNSFLSSAAGPFLDLFGQGFGLPRKGDARARVFKEDRNIRFYVRSGTLGQRLPDPSDPTKGRIPKGTTISTTDGTIVYQTTEDTTFPQNRRSVYVSAEALLKGSSSNVGANQLVTHSLGDSTILVTNDLAITTGRDLESDDEYRFRLVNAFSTRFSSNETAIRVAAASVPGVSRVRLIPFARGAGTFDVLLIPQGNKLPRSTKEHAERVISTVAAYGISSEVVEPTYVPISVSVRLRFAVEATEGEREAVKDRVQSAILRYIASVPAGGELVISQMISEILSVSRLIVDATIVDLVVDNDPRVVSNIRLEPDEILTPSEDEEAVVVI